MNDPSLIRIHRLQIYALAALLDLDRDILGKILKSGLASLTVILRIQLHSDICGASFVDYKAYQILKGIESLSSLSDQDAHIIAVHLDIQDLTVISTDKVDLHAHCLVYVAKESFRLGDRFAGIFKRFDLSFSSSGCFLCFRSRLINGLFNTLSRLTDGLFCLCRSLILFQSFRLLCFSDSCFLRCLFLRFCLCSRFLRRACSIFFSLDLQSLSFVVCFVLGAYLYDRVLGADPEETFGFMLNYRINDLVTGHTKPDRCVCDRILKRLTADSDQFTHFFIPLYYL